MIKIFEYLEELDSFVISSHYKSLAVMVSMKGLEGYSFDECLNMASVAEIDAVKVPFLHINQLIANKKAVNRPKDQVDVMELERIQKILGVF